LYDLGGKYGNIKARDSIREGGVGRCWDERADVPRAWMDWVFDLQ
jgi:hypothetical protein